MRARTTLGLLAAIIVPTLASAQIPAPTLDFSGLIFGNYQYRTDTIASNALGGKSPNRFDMGRVYLNFRMPAGDGSTHATVRIDRGNPRGSFDPIPLSKDSDTDFCGITVVS